MGVRIGAGIGWISARSGKHGVPKETYCYEDPEEAAKDLVASDVQAKSIDSNLALLGVELAPREGGELTNKEAAPLESARKIAIKCHCLPGSAARNLMIATVKATPKAADGWFCGKTSEATFRQVDQAIAQVGPDPKMGDPNLKTLLRGHTASLFSCRGYSCDGGVATSCEAGNDSWSVARERMDSQRSRWDLRRQRIGDRTQAGWYHCLDPQSKDFDKTNGLVAHCISEAWRMTLFHRWKTRGRINAKLCPTQTFNEERCSLTSKLIGTDGHRFAVTVEQR